MEKDVFDQPVENNLITYDNIIKTATSQLHNWLFIRLSLLQRKL